MALSKLESLPDEMLLEIISFLEPVDIANLQAQSKRLLKVCRDNSFWRTRCLLQSRFFEGINVRRGQPTSDGSSGDPLVSAAQTFQDKNRLDTESVRFKELQNEKKRIAANWDPTFKEEKISWYDEYIQRHGPVAVNWFEQPHRQDGTVKDISEANGVALYEPRQHCGELFAVSPLDDGSVCLWDVKGTRSKKGSIISRSAPGILRDESPRIDVSERPKVVSFGGTECVSVDSQRDRTFFAVKNHIMEVDLETMQVVGKHSYEWTITTISASHPTVPLSVGTLHGIHLHDSRRRTEVRRDHQERIDGFDQTRRKGLSRIWDSTPLQPYAHLTQPGPLSILHLEQPGSKSLISDDIFVAGRFSSILHYDRRMFPTIKGSLHSGARLCSMASLPYPFSWVDGEIGRRGELSLEDVDKSKSNPQDGRTLIACGEYNTKGSLEIYGLLPEPPSQSSGSSGVLQNSIMKNRQTASRSKLLSVINHGTRIVVSDGQGCLKWLERDGFTEVRSTLIGHHERISHPSLFASMPGSGEIARKLLSTQTSYGVNSQANNDDILFWTGERLGLVGFSPAPGFTAEDFEDSTKTTEEVAAEKEEHHYSEKMRLALERQANDVRFVQYLGAGIGN